MRAAIYARYSSDMQSRTSVEDQVRLCQKRIDLEGWQLTEVYADHGISGATLSRPGYRKLTEDARNGAFDILLAESIDRLSRDQEHIAALYKLLTYRSIPLVTVAEGEISELHIGLKGTMSALYLKDLAQKTHRGLEGRVRQKRSAGGVSYGYDVVRTLGNDGMPTTGERVINDEEASVIRQVFGQFASGRSPRAIAAALNLQGIDGPRGTAWGASTIYGNWRRGTGLLNNELYTGKLVWNRQRFVKDPDTGRRQARPNPPEQWIVEEVPELRIIEEELWNEVKDRQTEARSQIIVDRSTIRSERARRPRHLFSGIIECGVCGGGFILVNKHQYGCANVRNRGTCDNRLTMRRDSLEEAVLDGLRDSLLHPDLVAEFVGEYQREWNRLRGEENAARQRQDAELQKVERQIANIVTAVKNGLYSEAMGEELRSLEERKRQLKRTQPTAPEPPRLHPGLAELYRRKVTDLRASLNDDALKVEAAERLRSLLSAIRMIPEDGRLQIELVGELAAILALGQAGMQKSPSLATEALSITLVAGVGFEPTTFRL
ncbi:recombinase family protein [Georhizobium profundi]|uniref:Recombinase family protein n=2 Tax=Georhizobium profundi TaxID=2341112 RepID=A0A3Q8XS28_9HYPH|nr:recombinase family protein [Georhizobium profundi]